MLEECPSQRRTALLLFGLEITMETFLLLQRQNQTTPAQVAAMGESSRAGSFFSCRHRRSSMMANR